MKIFRLFLRITIIILGLVLAVLVGSRFVSKEKGSFHQQVPVEGYGYVSSFSLKNQDKELISNENLKGHWWLANFIFTRCQGPCPVITSKTRELQKDHGSQLRFVSFSVDPEYDTPDRLKEYANKFHADLKTWDFLTGDKMKIYSLIRNSFKLAVEPDHDMSDHSMDIIHSLHLVLVDPDGRVRRYTNSNTSDEMEELKKVLGNLK